MGPCMNPLVHIVKRGVDILFSSCALILCSPFCLLIAIAIKLDSKGPVFYSQERVKGFHEDPEGNRVLETFWMYKFRTMIDKAEQFTGAVLAGTNDPRITKVGKFLRHTRLDELPQFWHVLLGQMSVVGPRPERPSIFEGLCTAVPYFEERLRDIKPGITGLAQISLGYTGRLEPDHPLYPMKDILTNPFKLQGLEDSVADDMRTKMLFDFVYALALERFWSFFWMDLKIIVKTPLVMLLGKGR